MTDSSDDDLDMKISFISRRNGLDDQSLDALLGADSTSPSAHFEGVGVLLTDLRTLIEVPPPPPNSELAEMMARGLPAASASLAQSLTARRTARQRLRRTSLVLGLSAAVGLPLAGVAAAKDLLPTWMDDAIVSVIEAITPFNLSDRATGSEGNHGHGLSGGETKVVPGRQGPSTTPTQRPGGAASQTTGTNQFPEPVDSTPTGAKTSDQTGSGSTSPATSATPAPVATSRPAATSTTGPTATSTGPTATSTGPTASSTGPTASSTGPTASSTGPTASSTGPTASSTGPTASSTGPTTTFSPGAAVLGPGAPTTTNAPKVSAPALDFAP